jgi:hypothetical protein
MQQFRWLHRAAKPAIREFPWLESGPNVLSLHIEVKISAIAAKRVFVTATDLIQYKIGNRGADGKAGLVVCGQMFDTVLLHDYIARTSQKSMIVTPLRVVAITTREPREMKAPRRFGGSQQRRNRESRAEQQDIQPVSTSNEKRGTSGFAWYFPVLSSVWSECRRSASGSWR